MTWRGTTTTADRLFAALPYLLPLVSAVMAGQAFFLFISDQLPILTPVVGVLYLLISPVVILYSLVPGGFGSLIVFFLLLFLVVRNPNISHFIRFNTLQAILIGFMISVGMLLLSLLGGIPGFNLLIETFLNVLFLGGLAAVGYSIVRSLMGQYAEIPTISEAVYMQVR
ncbi:MAG: Tic20 family protein [Cyanobacteria bacterium P01_A01_bin.114]